MYEIKISRNMEKKSRISKKIGNQKSRNWEEVGFQKKIESQKKQEIRKSRKSDQKKQELEKVGNRKK